ncbi:hypothetical protein E2R16_06755 [Acinetobacter seifertii]|uniref:Uncharacterized protein n=1 Tax=Acinetobacter seifertii TaxID=1530123 RepID=A0A5E9PJT9_9GAMM|nr:hypothetical protein E2R16_06755 [Acinetobacter seifertii]
MAETTNVNTTETRASESKNITAIATTTAFINKFRTKQKAIFYQIRIYEAENIAKLAVLYIKQSLICFVIE